MKNRILFAFSCSCVVPINRKENDREREGKIVKKGRRKEGGKEEGEKEEGKEERREGRERGSEVK